MHFGVDPHAWWERNRKELIWLTLLGWIFVYMYSQWSISLSVSEPILQQDYALQMQGVEITDYWQEKPRVKVFGNEASVSQDQKHAFLQNVKIWIYDRESSQQPPPIDMIVTSKKGEVDWERGMITLSEDVVLNRQDQLHAEAQKAIYSYQEELLRIPEHVMIRRPGNRLTGQQFVYDVKRKTFQMRRAAIVQ